MTRGAEAREQDEVTYAWLFAQSKAQHGRIVALSVLCTVQAAVLVSFALACRAVIDQAVAGNIDGLLASAAILAGVIIAQLVLRLAINSTQERIRARFALELRKSILDSIFAARFGNVLRFHSGELSNRMFSDVQVVSNGVATIIPSFVSMLMQLVFAIAVLALISPPMVALFAAAALLSFVLARTLRGRLKALHKTVQEKEGAVRVFLQEALEHQLVIRSFGAQPATSARADTLQVDHFTAQMRRRGYSIAANASFSFFFNALYAVALTWCAFELLHGAMSYGTLMAVLQLVARIQAPVSSLSGMLPQLYQTLASAERLMEVAELPHSEGCLPVTAEEFYQRLSGVRMRDLAFSYDADEAEGAPAPAGGDGGFPRGGVRELDLLKRVRSKRFLRGGGRPFRLGKVHAVQAAVRRLRCGRLRVRARRRCRDFRTRRIRCPRRRGHCGRASYRCPCGRVCCSRLRRISGAARCVRLCAARQLPVRRLDSRKRGVRLL